MYMHVRVFPKPISIGLLWVIGISDIWYDAWTVAICTFQFFKVFFYVNFYVFFLNEQIFDLNRDLYRILVTHIVHF